MANGKGPGGQGGQGGQQGGAQGTQDQEGEGWQAQMQDRVNRLAGQVQSQSSQLADMTGSGIREWPLSSVVGALLVGVALGFVIGRQ